MIFGVGRLRQYLWGRHFEAITNQKQLLVLFGPDKVIPECSFPRVAGWSLMLSAYDYNLAYKPGRTIGRADGRSRLPLKSKNFTIDQPADIFMLEAAYPQILSPAVVAQASKLDPVLSRIHNILLQSGQLPQEVDWKPFRAREQKLSLQDGSVLWSGRVVIPTSLQKKSIAIYS